MHYWYKLKKKKYYIDQILIAIVNVHVHNQDLLGGTSDPQRIDFEQTH